MTFWILNQIKKLIAILGSNISPNQIAAGFAVGVWIGLTPFNVLVTPVLIALLFLFQINASMGLWAIVFAQLLAYLVDPIANKIGYFLLVNVAGLKPLWTAMYNAPIIPYTRFNNTMMLGSFVTGILLLVPMFFLAKLFVRRWRSHIQKRIDTWKVVKLIKGSKPFELWSRFKGLKDL